ncbi:unnamed protein product [Chironomus riparius]|uniref:Uncharacterized protein n=1 Tax=Chironomus riparius TaxID=315576 RepID=A0A9N9RKX0_9DIPT|nr:unnamed protein product [Chironomus riparius]
MKLLGAICLVLTALGFCSGENKNCFIELDEEIAKLECPVGYFKLEDCNNKFRCFGNYREKCMNNNKKTSNSHRVCSKTYNLECAKGILSRPGDYGWCEFNGNYPNFIKRNSLPTLFRQRFALGLPINYQNNANDDSDYPVDENKFSY